jgi:hypothetical protein
MKRRREAPVPCRNRRGNRAEQQLRAEARVGDYHVWRCTFKRWLTNAMATIQAARFTRRDKVLIFARRAALP